MTKRLPFLSRHFCISKEIKPVNPKGNQSWIFIGRIDAEAETPILWPPVAKNWFTGKDPDAGKDWRQEEKGMTEDEMVGWHYQLDGHEFEQALGIGDEQGSLVCCSPRGCKESDTTEWLNWTPLSQRFTATTGIFPLSFIEVQLTITNCTYLSLKCGIFIYVYIVKWFLHSS